jgi:integrase
MLLVMYSAALRLGELCGLNRGDYEVVSGRFFVQRQDSGIGGRTLTQTKTGTTKRVTLMEVGRTALDTHVRAHPMLPDAPMFTGPRGGRIAPGTIRRAWNSACVATGVENFHLHDIRHIALTDYARTGANVNAPRVRRQAQRKGLRLLKSRRDGTFMVVDPDMSNVIVIGDHNSGYGHSLADVEAALNER